MKTAIVGAGALGSLLAALIAKSGGDVVILERDRRVRRVIADNGLRYDGTGGEQRIPVTIRETAEGETADVVLVCVRTADIESAVDVARGAMGPESCVIGFQDGLGRFEVLRQAFGDAKAVAGWTGVAGSLVEPGHVLHSGWGDTRLAPADPGARSAVETVAANLTRVGIKTHVVEDLNSLLWTKAVIQSGVHPVATLAQLANGRILEIPEARALMEAAIDEAAEIVGAAGIPLLFSNPKVQARQILEMTDTHLCSMLQDFYRRRPLETELVNGAVVQLAREHGRLAPVNETLYRLLKTLETSRAEA